jgi:hypothetical protein
VLRRLRVSDGLIMVLMTRKGKRGIDDEEGETESRSSRGSGAPRGEALELKLRMRDLRAR